MNARPPVLVFIGGGPLQHAAFNYARELGAEVVLFDRNREAACRAMAVEHHTVDGADAVLDVVAKLVKQRDVKGVYCNNDFGLEATAAVNSALDLYGPTPDVVRACNDKVLMRHALRNAAMPVPKDIMLGRPSASLPSLPFPYPVIAKRTVGSGSVGIAHCDTPEALLAFLAAQPPTSPVIVEELVKGTHHDVNGFVRGGVFRPCGIADRFFGARNTLLPAHAPVSPVLPVRGLYPTSLAEDEMEEVYWVVGLAAGALGIDNCPVKADVVWSAKGPIILEIAPRFHGEMVSAYMIPAATDETPIKDWLAFLVSGKHVQSPAYRESFAAWHAVMPQRGLSVPVDARQRAEAVPGLVMLDWRFGATTGGGPYANKTDVKGLFVTGGMTREDTAERSRAALSRVLAAFGPHSNG